MKNETLFHKILPICLILLCLTFVKILLLECLLIFLLGYYIFRLVMYIQLKNIDREKFFTSKALKSEFSMMAFSFILTGIPLYFITHNYSPLFMWILFCFGLFMIVTVCMHMLRYNKNELLVFQNKLETKITLWIVSKLGNNR
jgi:hypothetical protein